MEYQIVWQPSDNPPTATGGGGGRSVCRAGQLTPGFQRATRRWRSFTARTRRYNEANPAAAEYPAEHPEEKSMLPELTAQALFTLEHSLAGPALADCGAVWTLLSRLADLIRSLAAGLPAGEWEEVAPEVWVARGVVVPQTATLIGPAIIGPDTELRPGAYVRGSVLVGRGCVVGNSTELKNCILFDEVEVPTSTMSATPSSAGAPISAPGRSARTSARTAGRCAYTASRRDRQWAGQARRHPRRRGGCRLECRAQSGHGAGTGSRVYP